MEGSHHNKIISLEGLSREGQSGFHQRAISSDFGAQLNYHFHSMSALEILRETVRILRFNCPGFVVIAACLICPVSTVQMSNLLVDQSFVRRLAVHLLLIARASGLPLTSLVKQSCQRFSEMAVSTAVCFPLYVTLLLLSKAAVVYSVDCAYSKKQFDGFKFCRIVTKLWKRVVVTYVWACVVIVGVITFLIIFGFNTDLVVYLAMVIGLVFSVVFAKAIIVSNIAVVISVLENASGPQALLRSTVLIRGQTQVGLLMYLGSTMGMTFVQGLFEHRVKTLSNGNGSSRIWEGPLLVVMYSLVVLIDSMMTVVFYFSCRSFSIEAANEEAQSILELATTTPKKGPSIQSETEEVE